MDKIHGKLRDRNRVWIDSSILDALRLLEEKKSINDVARILGRDRANLSRTLKKFREQDYPKLCTIVDAIRKEGLFEKTSLKERKQRFLEWQIREAEKGLYHGPPVFGYTFKDGVPFENEDLKKVEGVLRGFLAGKGPMEVARENDLSRHQVLAIRDKRFYMGEFPLLGKIYRGNWKPLITAEEWGELQRRKAPPKTGPSLNGYMWLDGKRVLRPGAKEMYQTIFAMRLNKESYEKIGERVGLSGGGINKLIMDRRITGQIIVDGKLVDSGFEQAVDQETWKAAQNVKVQTRQEKLAEESRNLRQKIMGLLPAFRWELREKTGASKQAIENNVKKLKREKIVKERDDGLVQKSWEPFPERGVETARKGWSMTRRRILEVLNVEGPLTKPEIAHKTGVAYMTVCRNIPMLVSEGLVSKHKRKYQLSELGASLLAPRQA